MASKYVLTCDNNFLNLALRKVLDACIERFTALPARPIRVLAICESDLLTDHNQFTKENISEFDIVLCRGFYCGLVRRFMPQVQGKFISIENPMTAIQDALHRAFLFMLQSSSYRETNMVARVDLNYGESTFIYDYLVHEVPPRIALMQNRSLKSVYNRKRSMMEKLCCETNQAFWLTLQFILQFRSASVVGASMGVSAPAPVREHRIAPPSSGTWLAC